MSEIAIRAYHLILVKKCPTCGQGDGRALYEGTVIAYTGKQAKEHFLYQLGQRINVEEFTVKLQGETEFDRESLPLTVKLDPIPQPCHEFPKSEPF